MNVGKDQAKTKPKVDTRADVVNQFTGEKWYYTDIVKEHFFNPRNLMLEDPDESQYDAIGMVGSPACIVPSTRVFANPALKPIDSVVVGEKVLSHDSQYHPVERIYRAEYGRAAKLIKIRNYLGELVATSGHLVFAKQIPKTSTFRHNSYKRKILSMWVHAGDLKKGDIALYPLPLEVRNVPHVSFVSARGAWDFKSKSLPAKVAITSNLLEFFGYFLAEGSTKKTEISLVFSDREMHLAERVKDLAKEIFDLGAVIRERKGSHRIDVAIYNVHLAKYLRESFGHLAYNKNIPEFVLFLEPELQKGLLMGLWRGDGHFASRCSQPRAGFVTVSPRLFEQVVFLLLRQRIVPSTFQEKEKSVRGVRHQKSYRVHVGDMKSLERLGNILGISFRRDGKKRHEVRVWLEGNLLCLPIKKVEEIEHSGGRLYNFEVQGSHTYATNAFLVHNCGDMMKMWLKIEPGTEKVAVMNWRTFGCGSAIAATSMFSVMVTENGGLTMTDALKIRPQDIMARLGGLPNRKIHCSVLADKAFRKAANEYFRKTGQNSRIIIDGAKVIDARLNITDKDIEEAVLEGAVDLDSVQKKLKVGIGSPEVIPEVEQLIRFYKEKYYG